VQGQHHRSIFGIIDADRAAQLFSSMLHLPEIVGQRTIEINPGIADADHGTLAHADRLNVNAFVLRTGDSPVEQVPQHKGQEVLIGPHFEVAIYLINNYCFAAYGARRRPAVNSSTKRCNEIGVYKSVAIDTGF
jgi:hypothetical protein